MTWTQEKLDKIVAMAKEGYKAKAIGAAVDKSPSAVIGQLNRLGISLRNSQFDRKFEALKTNALNYKPDQRPVRR